MNSHDSRRLLIIAILLTTLLEITVKYITNQELLQDPRWQMLLNGPTDLAWVIVIILVMFMFMDTKTFDNVYNRRGSLRSNFLFTIVTIATILLCISVCISVEDKPTLYFFGNIPSLIMLTCFIGGPYIGIPVSIIVSMIITLLVPNNASINYEIVQYSIVISMIVSCYMSWKKYPSHGRSYLAVYIIGLACVVALYVMLLISDNPLTEEDYEIANASVIISVITGTLSVFLMNMFFKIHRDMKDIENRNNDLRLAHEIQLTSLPRSFPNSNSMDVYAFMEPATEIGGDFYDCVKISDNLTLYVVADVSDKGLPASLLMMRSMGMIRTAATIYKDPAYILRTFNNELCDNNPANQFVSVWVGIYDSDTGTLCYSNAGHTPPYISRNGNDFERLPIKKGLIVGAMEDIRYTTSRIQLCNKDVLFAYTDGVNEAFNKDNEQFGHKRLIESLNASDRSSSRSIIESVKKDVLDFISPCERSDDITMLCLSIDRSNYHSITVPGEAEQLDRVNEFIEEIYLDAGFPLKDVQKMEIVCEEIFINICDHAYNDRRGEVTILCACIRNEMKLTFCDNAPYFNPIDKEDINIDEDVNKWPIGGFGIHMVKNLVTYMNYKYFADQNIFTVWKVSNEKTEKN